MIKKLFLLFLVIIVLSLKAQSINIQSTPTPKDIKPQIEIKGILYLTSPDTGKVVFLDLSDLSKINHIQTPGSPWEIAFDKLNKIIFVSDFAKDRLYKLKLHEKLIYETIETGSKSGPRDIEVSEDGSIAFIVESLTNNFVVYNPKEKKNYFTKTKILKNPSNFAILKDPNLIAITHPNSNNIVFLNGNSFEQINQTKVDKVPERIIADPIRKLFYVTNRNGNSITIIDASTMKIKNTIITGETPISIALSEDGKYLYVGNAKSNTVNVIDIESKETINTIELPIETQFPGDVELTNNGKFLVVTSETTNKISIIDLSSNKIAVKLDVGATTHAAYVVESNE